MGTLDRGDDFVEMLIDVCKKEAVTAGEIRAVGHFDEIELVHFDSRKQRYEVLVEGEGSFDLVSLNGNISRLGEEVVLRLDAVFNVIGPLGPQMVGGQLRRARVVSSEFVIDSYGDLRMERRLDPGTGRLLLDKIDRIAGAAPAVEVKRSEENAVASAAAGASLEVAEEPTMSWGEAIAEVEEEEKVRSARKGGRAMPKKARKEAGHDPFEELDLDEPFMSPGDYLDHVKLGRCKIMKVEDDQYIHIRLPRGRIRKLALEILEISYYGEEDGRNIFEARVRR